MRPAILLAKRELRFLECGGGREAFPKQRGVEVSHELTGRFVVDLPKTGEHTRGSGVHEAPSQAHEPFAAHLRAQAGAARAQHHEIGGQVQTADVVQSQESIFRPTALVVEREDDAGQLRVHIVQDAVRGEMHDAIPAQIAVRNKRAIGIEAERGRRIRRELENLARLAACREQPRHGQLPADTADIAQRPSERALSAGAGRDLASWPTFVRHVLRQPGVVDLEYGVGDDGDRALRGVAVRRAGIEAPRSPTLTAGVRSRIARPAA